MKKSRLLEIIREEISSVLGEAATTYAGKSSIDDLKKDKAFGGLTGDAKTDAVEKLNSGGTVTIGEEKAKKLAEKYQLDEETINEMASIVQTKKALQKLGDEARLKIVQDVEKETLAQFKKNPIVSSDGRLARKLEPEEITGKRDTRGYGADFERNFKKKAGMDFLDFTTSIDIELKKKFPEEKFTPGLATNTTEKDAANQITGKEPGQRGRKADPNKPEKPASTGKKGRPAGAPKAEKVATRTPGDDGFDNVSYSDDEESAAAAKAASSDSTAKELASTPEEKKIKFNQFLASVKKNKDDKAKIDGILKLAKDKFKFAKSMMDDLKRAAGREVEA
jgi:hypothetical protein